MSPIYVSHPELHKVKGGGIAGAIMVSGIYDLTASPVGDAEIAYFGSDPSRYAERSSLRGLLETKIPLMAHGRRTRSTAIHRAIRIGETGHLQKRRAVRAHLHAAAAQPHVGGLRDQHRGYAADRRNSGICEDGEVVEGYDDIELDGALVLLPNVVMPGLVPGIHVLGHIAFKVSITPTQKVEEIADAISKLRRMNSPASAAGFPRSRPATPIMPKSSTPPRPIAAASRGVRLPT